MRADDRTWLRDPILLAVLTAIGAPITLACSDASEGSSSTSRVAGGEGMGAAEGGGAGGNVSGSAGVDGVDASPAYVRDCENPRPYQSEATGWIECDGGFLHRERAGTCERAPPVPPVDGGSSGGASGSVVGECFTDADCAHVANGRCSHLIATEINLCTGGCLTDQECATGQVCVCDGPLNRCVPAGCTTDADCGAGLLCMTYDGPINFDCDYGVLGTLCQTRSDECVTTAHCATGSCEIVDDTRVCIGAGGCGRPFVVEGLARMAGSTIRADWTEPCAVLPDLASLTPAARASLAEHFTRMGLLEHASIAAFARFMLELLAVGAPADLVAEAAQAVEDERRHAVTCFTIASAYAGAPVGPGPLALDDCRPATDLRALVETTFLEGCIGETTAALEARELAGLVEDPALKTILSGIAEDETRHAALAWRTVSWAFAQDPERVAPLLRRLEQDLRAELSTAPQAPKMSAIESTERLGVPSVRFSADVRRRALTEIVLPCLRALSSSAHTRTRPLSLVPRLGEGRPCEPSIGA